MNDIKPKPQAPQASHYIPAEQYLRERMVTVTLADAAAWHAATESKRPVKCIAQMLGAYTGKL